MKTKKIFPVLFVLFSVFSGCENSGNEVTIGFLMENYNSTRWTQDRKHFEERIKELKGKTIVKYSDGSDVIQYQQAIEMIDQGVNVLVIVSANRNTSAAIVREAHKKGIKVIAYDRFISNSNLDYFIGFDSEHTGILQAKYALERKPKGNYVLIGGDSGDANAVYIRNGQLKTLEEKLADGQIKILFKANVDEWNPIEAAFNIEKVINLSPENIDAVLVANDGMAMGVISKLREYNLDKDVITTGLDAELAACQRIYRGEQSMTVYSPIKNLAIAAADLAMDLALSKNPKYEFVYRNNGRVEVPSIILKPISVDKNNLESSVIKDGVYTLDQIQNVN